MHIEKQITKLISEKKYKEAVHLCESTDKSGQNSPSITLLHAQALHDLSRYKEAFDKVKILDNSDEALLTKAAIIIDWCNDFLYKIIEAPPYDLKEFLISAIDICDKLITTSEHYKLDAMYFKGNALSALGHITESRLLLHQICDKASIDWTLLAETIINLGNSYQQEGRFVEAIEIYEKAVKRMPNFSMGWNGFGNGLLHAFHQTARENIELLYMSLFCFYKAKDLVDPQEIRYVKAVETGLEYALAVFQEKPSRKAISEWSPISEMEISSNDVNNIRDFFYKCATQNYLFLNLCLGCKKCKRYFQDEFLIDKLTTKIEDCRSPYNLFSYFAEIRRDFFVARWLYVKSQHDKDKEIDYLNSIYKEIDLLDYGSGDIRQELLKMSLQKAVGIFDKIAFFLNEYEDINIPHHKVWFSSKGKKDIFTHFENKYTNLDTIKLRNLQALKSISTDLKHPYFEACKIFRDSITHKYLKVHLDFSPIDTLRYPCNFEKIINSVQEPHNDLHNPKNYHIIESELGKICIETLKMARAAIFYLSGHVNCNELDKRIRNPDKIIPSLYFDNIIKHKR